MSDPVTNVEIEDVLSSIRRLISENDRPQKQGADTSFVQPENNVGAPEEETEGRILVLTPALRVRDSGLEAERDLEKTTAEREEALEPPAFDPVEGLSLKEAQAIDARIVRWDHLKEGRVAEDPGYEPDEPGDSEYAGTDVDPLEWQDEAFDDAVVVDTAADEVATDESLSGLTEQVTSEVYAELSGQVEERLVAEDALDDFSGDDAVVLDEAVLRDMVADIVRQELQGALGERITRNVRKLVRREIHRALAAHELD